MAPVSGQVTIDGKPLTTGVVRFAPEGGRASQGAIDKQGRFTLGSYEAADGALLGSHRVMIVAREQLTDTTCRWYAPKHYASFHTSGLTAEVRGPTADLKLELTWGNQKGPFVERD
jgi:hypothetical protein